MAGASTLSAPPNQLSQTRFDFSKSSSLTIWVMPISHVGTVFVKTGLSVYFSSSNICLDVEGSVSCQSSASSMPLGNIYLGKWTYFSLVVKEDASYQDYKIRFIDSIIIDYSHSPKWEDPLGNMSIGLNMNTYVYQAIFYDGDIIDTDFAVGILYNLVGGACYSPIGATYCPSTELDHEKNRNGQACSCSSGVSCGDTVSECREAPSCSGYAASSYPHNCLDMSTLCGTLPYLESMRECTCVPNCTRCDSDNLCLSCVSGMDLVGGSCVCPSGYYVTGENCVACMSECATCTDTTSCSCLLYTSDAADE